MKEIAAIFLAILIFVAIYQPRKFGEWSGNIVREITAGYNAAQKVGAKDNE